MEKGKVPGHGRTRDYDTFLSTVTEKALEIRIITISFSTRGLLFSDRVRAEHRMKLCESM